MQNASKPSVFVSSTIQDFLDLRDALKYWLEEMGFDVQMSEHTDFVRRPGAGTFEACFDSIRTSDYYMLLIGARRGSWFDRKNGISVTRQEYRVARQCLSEARRPTILPFVRHDVVVALDERRRSGSLAGSGSTLEDPDFSGDFLQEVRREEHTLAASLEGEHFPSHNWLAEFRNFRELVDVLRNTFRLKEPLARMATIEAIIHELEGNLRLMVMDRNGHPFFYHWWLNSCREAVLLDLDKVKTGASLPFNDMQRFIAYVEACAPLPGDFSRSALDDAIASGILLEFDSQAHAYRSSHLLNGLCDFRAQLDNYQKRRRTVQDLHDSIWAIWQASRPSRSAAIIPGPIIASVFSLHESHQNLARLLIALLRYLRGKTRQIEVDLRPISPIVGESERIEAEHASVEQIREWIEGDNWRLARETREKELNEADAKQVQAVRNYMEAMFGREKALEVIDKIMQQQQPSE